MEKRVYPTVLILVVLILAQAGCQSPAATELPALTAILTMPTAVAPTFTQLPPVLFPETAKAPASAPATPTPAPGSLTRGSVQAGSLNRGYLAYVPAHLPANAPLLLVFHGYGSTATDMRAQTGYEFEGLADRKGFLLVYPEGIQMSWNDCRKFNPFPAGVKDIDDVGFVHELIATLKSDYDIDPSRVFATGFSNGGMLALRLALELPDEITAIAAVSAMLPVVEENQCRAVGKPIPALIMNGTADPILPYAGGYGGGGSPILSTQATAEYFVQLNGLAKAPQTKLLLHVHSSDPTLVERTTWAEVGKPEVVLVKIQEGGHAFPQSKIGYRDEYGPVTGDLEAPVEIWDFFSRQAPLQ